MKFADFIKNNYESRKIAAERLNMSYFSLGNMVMRNPNVLELKDGRFIVAYPGALIIELS